MNFNFDYEDEIELINDMDFYIKEYRKEKYNEDFNNRLIQRQSPERTINEPS